MIPHLKPDSFLHNYMESLAESETPLIYDFICACWCLSTVMGRDVVIARPSAPVHLNMYIILVSESGTLRKSTSVRHAVSLLRAFMSEQKSSTLLIESKVTMGMLLNELSRQTREVGTSQAILVASELAAMLGRGTNIAGIPALLTDLYDCPDERSGGGSLSTGSFNFKNVYCSFLAGSTPSWLSTAVRPEIIAGGFTSRCYFIQGRNRKQLVAWGEQTKPNWQESLIAQLKELQHESRSFPRIGINHRARETFSLWYGARPSHKDVYRESFESREDSHVLRFAALFAINERAWEIGDDHIRRAIDVVAEIKRYGTELFSGVKAEHASARLVRKIRTLLISAGTVGLSRSELYRACNLQGRAANELRSVISTMHELDLVRVTDITMPRGRPRRMYYATEFLSNELLLEDVTRKLGIE